MINRHLCPWWVLSAAAICSLANAGFLKAQQNAPPAAAPAASQSTSGSGQSQTQTPAPAASGTSGKSNGQTQTSQAGQTGQTSQAGQRGHTGASAATPTSAQQPKRILGVMPNFRAVSAGVIPPPPTPKQSFDLATQNSFDYSAFVFVGVTSAMAEGTDSHADLGKGGSGFGRYYWRGLLDKTDGNYLVLFALPTVFHQDERYFAMGKGGIWKRGVYAASRVFITPDYHGHNSFNFSELLGRGMAQGISVSYYPSHDRTLGALSAKFGYAVGRDALTAVFREFWPDISAHLLHRQP
jgi:hypothetical protein